jgi:hypothetical protein
MLPLYLGALGLGGVLILASVVLGGGDHDSDAHGDVDHDADLDHDHDHDHDLAHGHGDAAHGVEHAAGAGPWLPFLTMRFWTFALATFGLTGALLTLLDFSQLIAAPVSTVMGLGLGTGISWGFRQLRLSSPTGSTGMRNLAGRDGTVLLPISPGGLGKVRLLIDGQYVDVPARTRDAHKLGLKQSVIVVEVIDGVAEVTGESPGRTLPAAQHQEP